MLGRPNPLNLQRRLLSCLIRAESSTNRTARPAMGLKGTERDLQGLPSNPLHGRSTFHLTSGLILRAISPRPSRSSRTESQTLPWSSGATCPSRSDGHSFTPSSSLQPQGFRRRKNDHLGNRSVYQGNSMESDRDVGENLIAETSACPRARTIQSPPRFSNALLTASVSA